MAQEVAAKSPLSLSTVLTDWRGNRFPLAIIVASTLIFCIAVPFARVPLSQMWAFMPIYQSALILNDLITAVLLFTHFVTCRSRAVLVLACGYLFTAAMAAVHLLTFPGLFSGAGLLGSGPQTTAWLYMFWHGAFPISVIAYALLKKQNANAAAPLSRSPSVAASAAVVLVLACALMLLATLGQTSLPDIMRGNSYTPLMLIVVATVWGASFLALAILWVRRPHTRLDTWLMVVMCAWIFDIALSAVFNAGRFDLGFYAGRIYGLLAATVVLFGLLIDMGAMHARLARLFEAGQEALRHEVEENRRIFETSLDLIMITDRRGKIVRISPSAGTVLGYQAEEMIGRNGGEFVYPDDLEAVRNEMRLARRGKQMRHFETRYVHKAGQVVTLAWSGVWSEPEQRHFFIGRDMTESRRAREALLDSEQMALAIIDTAIDAFVQLDGVGVVIDWNRQAEAMFGRSREQAVGSLFAEFGLPDKIREDFPRTLAQSVHGSEQAVPVRRYESTGLRGDGSEFPIEVSMTVLHRSDGYVFNAFIRDLTEKIRIEEQFRQAQKMEAVGELTGGLAHDFNNLLAIVIGNLDVLNEFEELSGDQKELVGAAIGAALSGSELTRRLLAFARRQPLQPECVDLNELVTEISKLLCRTLGDNIEIKLDLDAAAPQVLVDPVQLETAIANLANNARDAMPEGGRLYIATRSAYLDEAYAAQHVEVEPGDYVAIEVTDTGKGMPADILARIFEPFFTTKEVGKGTGLGLSMVFGFMKQSKGHINVYSEPGRGTTFRLYLKPARAAAVPVIEAPPTQPAEGMSGTILVVEDNHRLREVVVKQLRSLGLSVLEAENAQQALDRLAATTAVDLVFSDVMLPGGMDGIALMREVVKRYPGSKVLLTSGFPGKRLADAEGLGSSVRLLSKPYRKDELARHIRESLQGRSGIKTEMYLTTVP
jgi:PAS domain S-box-containing protein